MLLLTFGGIFILSWYLKFNQGQIAFVAVQLLCFVLYSVPPFRFKKNIYISAALESLYSGTLMYLLVLSVNVDLASIFLFIFLALWAFFKGLRNFVLHTMNDKDKDLRIGVRTLGNTISGPRLIGFMTYVVIPLEVLSMLAFLLKIHTPLNIVFILAYLLLIPFSIIHKSNSRTMGKYGFLANINLFHELVLLMLSLLVLTLFNFNWMAFIILTLILFNTYIRWIESLYRYLRNKVS